MLLGRKGTPGPAATADTVADDEAARHPAPAIQHGADTTLLYTVLVACVRRGALVNVLLLGKKRYSDPLTLMT